jgi:2-polyprenyl-6-methoxyphenol hydroxylase-like FAD-dependent oxidoreductase
MESSDRALIIGGGIGGLSAAIALQHDGIPVRVFERSSELHEVGAGVGLQLGAVKALKRMNMLAPIVEIGSEPLEALELHSYRSGKLLGKLPQREIGGPVGLFGVNVHRGELLATLAKHAGSEVIELGAECTGFEQDADGVTARFADGREERGAALIGADGIRSTIRGQIHGNGKPRYSGYSVWRSMPPFQDDRITDGYPHQAVGPGGGFGMHPKGELMYWFAAMARPEGAPDPPEGMKHELRQIFGDWYDPIPAIIEATPDEAIFHGDIYDRPPLKSWGSGRVTLLGDAAHPTTPSMGQGAGMAIEDAAVLAEELSLDPSLTNGARVTSALQSYEGRRVPRTTSIVNTSWRLSQIYNVKNPLVSTVRETVMRLVPDFVQRKEFEAVIKTDL